MNGNLKFVVYIMQKTKAFLRQLIGNSQASTSGKSSVDFELVSASTAVLTLNNPARHNAIAPQMMLQLSDIIDRLSGSNNEKVHTLVVRGAGDRSFCAGMDLSHAHMYTPEAGREMSLLMQDTLTRLQSLPLISIAAITGPALGGGAELAMACDMRVMHSDVHNKRAYLQFVQARMGVVPGWGGCTRLVSIVGRSRALQLLCGMPRVHAQLGLDWGLCDAVLPANIDFSNNLELVKWVETELLPGQQDGIDRREVLRAMKRAVHASDAMSFEDGLKFEHKEFASLWGTGANLQILTQRSSSSNKL